MICLGAGEGDGVRRKGLTFPLGSNPPIPKPKTLPTVLSIPEMRKLLNNTLA